MPRHHIWAWEIPENWVPASNRKKSLGRHSANVRKDVRCLLHLSPMGTKKGKVVSYALLHLPPACAVNLVVSESAGFELQVDQVHKPS